MGTNVGRTFKRSRIGMGTSLLTAFVIVGCDLFSVRMRAHAGIRILPALLALVTYGLAAGWDRPSMGLRLRPLQSWTYWAKATVVMGAIVLLFSLLVVGGFALLGHEPRVAGFSTPSQFWWWVPRACLLYPIVEEYVYRFVLCTPIPAAAGKWGTILLSGVVFAALHFVGGNPSPDNFIAGYLLGWAYLKSESIVVPVCLHSLGNLCVGLFYLALCYWQP